MDQAKKERVVLVGTDQRTHQGQRPKRPQESLVYLLGSRYCTQQDQGGPLRIQAKTIDAVGRGVPAPAEFMAALLVAGAELLGETALAEDLEGRGIRTRQRKLKDGQPRANAIATAIRNVLPPCAKSGAIG
jgi:hypothetical protein